MTVKQQHSESFPVVRRLLCAVYHNTTCSLAADFFHDFAQDYTRMVPGINQEGTTPEIKYNKSK